LLLLLLPAKQEIAEAFLLADQICAVVAAAAIPPARVNVWKAKKWPAARKRQKANAQQAGIPAASLAASKASKYLISLRALRAPRKQSVGIIDID
jgi:DTW domain-containing protein YfiP